MADPLTPPIAKSNTKKWALWGPLAVGLLQTLKLIPGLASAGPVIDKICEAILLATGGGVAFGLRNAIGK